MVKKVIFPVVIFCLGMFFNCSHDNFRVHKSGLKYKFIIENKKNAHPAIGDILTVKMEFTDSKGNSIEKTEIFRTQLKPPSHNGGSIEDGLAMMHKGDSAVFLIKATDYYNKTLKQMLPDQLSGNEYLHFYIKLADITAYNDFIKERQIARLSDEREEKKQLDNYLASNGFMGKSTSSGLYFVELKRGTGITPKAGQKVTVHYNGYFIDGQLFDSSYKRNKPFTFKYGVGEVIEGWDEGLAKMRVGGLYKLIIPSKLAYGSEVKGPIPPYSTLVFEIELLKVE